MNILVVGGGGREHALCWAINKSPKCSKLFCAPGNAGIAEVADCVNISGEDVAGLVNFAKEHAIELVIVGPEAPLVLGLVDALEAEGIKAFGPSAAAAELEGSKAFMKDLFAKYNIPTAAYGRFTDYDQAVAYVQEQGAPIVVKASGLAAGKGVILAASEAEAVDALDQMMNNKSFGDAGEEVVIEEFLDGEEASFFALVDGKTALPLISAQDHKAAYDGDKGPNTGGMGAYSPAPVVTDALAQEIMATIIQPTIDGMAAEGCPYKGVLFAGLMIKDGKAKTLEFNVRFGDPECQVLMARLSSDIVEALDAAAMGKLDEIEMTWLDDAAMVVVMAAEGYPGSYEKGSEIKNLSAANAVDGVTVLHAGTKAEDGKILASGGRVLGVTALGRDVAEAQAKAYQAVDCIDWPQGFCRRDIGWRAINRNA
ncbi:MAG: phosphoribosylamine--glycine ligase [Rhodospirillaceae bacterium]|jgi:phosphoribosylamine---glycine ligase|nr:phosphoribosylamine--glycine ligase [Rhodospirillaceae bacterium]MBT4587871.1 phosphoribosylamine--glycine ligase [Rhodospirillaceae bacterium]MBT5941417.1 phosphoribosylamine--glycine ligase [Rhodospirillaceae bacterium]MBT7266636.1 phosphoribosylamine--glycine ligase [Rhodospirillaceae bacterium]